MKAMLSHKEIERPSRFKFEDDRYGSLRHDRSSDNCLACISLTTQNRFSLEYNAWGKPALASKFADSDISFNLSHSHGLAVYAVARVGDVGVNVDMVRPNLATGRVAERAIFLAH
jgi:4'-phosphopantetheinyl transferase